VHDPIEQNHWIVAQKVNFEPADLTTYKKEKDIAFMIAPS